MDAHKIRLCSFSGVLLPNTSTLAALGLLLAGSVLPNARRAFCGARRLDSTVLAILPALFRTDYGGLCTCGNRQ